MGDSIDLRKAVAINRQKERAQYARESRVVKEGEKIINMTMPEFLWNDITAFCNMFNLTKRDFFRFAIMEYWLKYKAKMRQADIQPAEIDKICKIAE